MQLLDISQFAEQFQAIAAQPVPACQCRECDELSDEPQRFDCAGCDRVVPYCFGADDHLASGFSLFDYCDICALVLIRAENDTSWKDDAKAIAEMFGVSSQP